MHILTIVGPTAVGKTEIAMKIATRLSGEIISADSRQIYKYLDIGTAKPTEEQRRRLRFHLIDFIEPDDNYSCGQFARDAEEKIKEICKRNKTPIVCGGTGLYIRALFHPLDVLPQSNSETKDRLRAMLEQQGIEHMYNELRRIDPDWAERISPQDKQRILRGIEVYEIAGKPLTKMMGKRIRHPTLQPHYIGMRLPREDLYSRINQRFDKMLEAGLVGETESLLKRGFKAQSSALRTIGYKEIVGYLQGSMSLETAVDRAKRRTRNYAKRQLTWFNKIARLLWYDSDDRHVLEPILKDLQKAKVI